MVNTSHKFDPTSLGITCKPLYPTPHIVQNATIHFD